MPFVRAGFSSKPGTHPLSVDERTSVQNGNFAVAATEIHPPSSTYIGPILLAGQPDRQQFEAAERGRSTDNFDFTPINCNQGTPLPSQPWPQFHDYLLNNLYEADIAEAFNNLQIDNIQTFAPATVQSRRSCLGVTSQVYFPLLRHHILLRFLCLLGVTICCYPARTVAVTDNSISCKILLYSHHHLLRN